MSFMTKFWALIALAMVLAFGGNVPNAFAKTPTEIRACVDRSFASAPFTGTLAQKEIQATRLAARTTVTVEGLLIKLPQGSSIWQQCEGISAVAPTTTRVTDLEGANSALKREVRRLEGLAYETINTRDRATGFVSDGSTRKDRATTLKGELKAANRKTASVAVAAVLSAIGCIIATLVAVWLAALVRRKNAELAQAKFTIGTLRPASWGGDTAADAGLDIPPAPDAPATEKAPEAPAPEAELPDFLKRLNK